MSKISPLSDYDKFYEAVQKSKSITEVITNLGLRAAGGNYRQAKLWALRHGIDLPVYIPTMPKNNRKYTDSDLFVENSTYKNSERIKSRLLAMGWLYECSIRECTTASSWLGKPISLHLDHINGRHTDNRLENLRFLCPNCHSQTDTFSRRVREV